MKVLYGSLLSIALLLGILIVASERPAARDERTELPMTFAHADHQSDSCVTCHHNFADSVGFGGECIHCHQTDPTVSHLVEEQFHDLCRGCHVERRAAGETSGPLRQCRLCHTRDEAP
jgi:predicted CXXCH cytochrome family protein